MGVTEVHQAFGDWSIQLNDEVPATILRALTDDTSDFLGHLIITPTRVDPRVVDPLTVARYTGVYRKRDFTRDRRTISGSSLVWWLGDLDKRGPEINESLQTFTSASFEDLVNGVLPAAIPAGTIHPEVGTQSFSFLFRTSRYRLARICDAYAAEFEITPQGTLNAGSPANLFPTFTNPQTFIKRRGSSADPNFKYLPLAEASLGADWIDVATRKLLVATEDEVATIKGEADLATSKRDLHGNLVTITDVSAESDSSGANADARAAALLASQAAIRNSVRISTEDYDVDGTVGVGDSVYVWDPDAGLYDLSNEINYQGATWWPAKLRVLGITWPLALNADGSKPGVYFREPTMTATLHDLTDYVIWEQGSTELDVGSFARKLIPDASESLGPITAPETEPASVPLIPDTPSVFGDERQLLVQAPTTTGGSPQPLSMTKLNVYASTTSGFTPGPTNYIGYISISGADIKLGVDVVKRFPWPEDAQTYVRVTGANSSVEGPASVEVPVTAGLIPSAAILNLVADKLTAGTITASITIMSPEIYGGIIATATGTGQRVAMEEGDFDRIKFYSGIAAETREPYITASGADGNMALVGIEFSDSAGDTGNINIGSKGGPSAFASSWINLSAVDISIGTFSGSSRIFVADDLQLGSDNNVNISSGGSISLFGDNGFAVLNASAFDIGHDLGGRIWIDDWIEMISGGSVRAYFDDIPGGGTGDSPLRLVIQGIGTRRIVADAIDTGGAGFRRLIVSN